MAEGHVARPARPRWPVAVVAIAIAVVLLAVYAGGYACARWVGMVGWHTDGEAWTLSVAGACTALFTPAFACEKRWIAWRNERWLARNGALPGVTTTASGLQVEVIAASTRADARRPAAQDVATVRYRGTSIDGVEFDASGPDPREFSVSGVIRGFTEALLQMREGDRWRIFIPPELAYGDTGVPPRVGPRQILIFELELVEVLR